MLNGYKTREANCKEEIEKLTKLTVIKDEEITDLDMELQGLNDFLSNLRSKQLEKIHLYRKEISENLLDIKRNDKLIVDLQQRNEISQNAVNITQE